MGYWKYFIGERKGDWTARRHSGRIRRNTDTFKILGHGGRLARQKVRRVGRVHFWGSDHFKKEAASLLRRQVVGIGRHHWSGRPCPRLH
jgi:hypothetical protein